MTNGEGEEKEMERQRDGRREWEEGRAMRERERKGEKFLSVGTNGDREKWRGNVVTC